MVDFFLVTRRFPKANQLWIDWCAVRATAEAWHPTVRVGRFHHQQIPPEWLFGPLLAFFDSQHIQFESTVIFDGGVIVAAFQRYRGRKGQYTRRGRPRVHEKAVDAWSAALTKGFELLERRIRMNNENAIGIFSKDNPTRTLHSPHDGPEDRLLDDGSDERDGHE